MNLGSTATPHVLQQWSEAKRPGSGTLLLPDGTTAFEMPRQVYLTQDLNRDRFAVTIALFRPGPEDETAYRWTDASGKAKVFDMPPYYICDMDEAKANIRDFFTRARREWPLELLKKSNPVVQKTFLEAERYYDSSKVETILTLLMLMDF